MAETQTNGLEVLETREWLDSLDYVLSKGGPERADGCCSNSRCMPAALPG